MNDKLELIVRELAAGVAPIIDGTYHNGHDWCTLCLGEGSREERHDKECPWRMAREWVKYHEQNLRLDEQQPAP